MTWKLSGECREGGKGTGWLSCEQTKQCARDERRSSGLGVIKFRLVMLPNLLSVQRSQLYHWEGLYGYSTPSMARLMK